MKTTSIKQFLYLFLLALGGCAFFRPVLLQAVPKDPQRSYEGDTILENALMFKSCIQEKNLPCLKKILGPFFEDFQTEYVRVMYDDQYVAKAFQRESAKSLSAIITAPGSKIVYEGNALLNSEKQIYGYVIYFVAPSARVKRSGYRVSRIVSMDSWMTDYAVCTFVLRDGRLEMFGSFCYWETEGP